MYSTRSTREGEARDWKQALAPKGIYVMTGDSSTQMFQSTVMGPLTPLSGDKKMGNLMAKPTENDPETMRDILETGKVVPVTTYVIS